MLLGVVLWQKCKGWLQASGAVAGTIPGSRFCRAYWGPATDRPESRLSPALRGSLCSHSYWRRLFPLQAQDVYTGDIISGLHSKTNFTVVINPSGVVMWYLYPIRKLGMSQQ